MLCSEAVSRINAQLGYRSDKADEILADLQDSQQTLERGIPSPLSKMGTFLPWFLMSERASATTTINEERLLLPTDLVGELQDFRLFLFDASAELVEDQWQPLEKSDEGFLRAKFPGTGAPKAFCYSGSYWRLFPTPDDEYTMKVIYGATDTQLTLAPDITNKWLTTCPWVLIASAGMQMAAKLRDAGAMTFFQNRLAIEIPILYNDTVARTENNARAVMGGYN